MTDLYSMPICQIISLSEAIGAVLADGSHLCEFSGSAKEAIRRIDTGLRWFDLGLTERILLRATWEVYNRYTCPLELNRWPTC